MYEDEPIIYQDDPIEYPVEVATPFFEQPGGTPHAFVESKVHGACWMSQSHAPSDPLQAMMEVNLSAPFADASPARELPWTGYEREAVAMPGPGAYAPLNESTFRPPRPTTASAAFASTTPRFAQPTASAAAKMGTYGQERPQSARRGGQPSAAFASTSTRFAAPKPSPSPGEYNPQKHKRGEAAAGAAFASTSSRRLPFEEANDVKGDSPPPNAYGRVSSARGPRGAMRTSGGGGASIRYTSERFGSSRSDVPGPGEYEAIAADAALSARGRGGGAGSRAGLPVSTSKARALPFFIPDSPGAGSYDPRPVGGSYDVSACASRAAFASASPRFVSSEKPVPGPGSYSGPARTRIRRSASFGTTSKRFAAPKPSVGPGEYEHHSPTGKVLGAQPASTAFTSGVRRIELPFESHVIEASYTPGPGAHNDAKIRRHGGAATMAAAGAKPRSAAFVSTSPRFSSAEKLGPAPGAYDPRFKYNATTQRYSVRRL